jgi:hypothetical protein
MTFQLFKPITSRNAQIIEVGGSVYLAHFSPRGFLNIRRQLAAAPAIPNGLGFGVGEGADHKSISKILF